MFRSIFPFILLAGAASIAFDLFGPKTGGFAIKYGNTLLGNFIVVLLGIPVYLCNGADVLLLRPLLQHSEIYLGTAIAFSLTTTSLCISSIVLLSKFLGLKHTVVLTAYIGCLSLVFAQIINFGS